MSSWSAAARLCAALLLAPIPGIEPTHAAPSTPLATTANEQQLKQLRARIEHLKRELNETRGRRDEVRDELRDVDRRIGSLVSSLRRLDAGLASQRTRIQRLDLRRKRERSRLQQQAEALARQVRATYVMGRQEYIKLLLNQQDPTSVARTLVYYRYFSEARAGRIHGIRSTLHGLDDLQDELGQRARALAVAREREAEQRQALESSRARRAELLVHLNRRVANQSQEIKRLKADEGRLERLLGELKSYLPDIPPLVGKETSFANLKGKLMLPVKGRVTARYGEPKQLGDLKWRGIFVAAREGREVRAVFRGRVAYADWLRGFGLLLIMDHGDGYMTLYGHNESLYRGVGDWVETGEVIASVGTTGDTPSPGVYFEIRHNGKPYDPLRWCSARSRAESASR